MRKLILFLTFVLVLAPQARSELKNGMSADIVLGQPDFNATTARNGGFSAKSMSNPTSVLMSHGRLFVLERNNHRLMIFNEIPKKNFSAADVVVGQESFTAVANATAVNRFNFPRGLAFDGQRIFVAEDGSHRVVIFNQLPMTNNANADVVIGQTNFTNNGANQGGGVLANTLSTPRRIFSDGIRLFVPDSGNNRVLIFNRIPTSNNASADVVIGQPDFISNAANQGGAPQANTLSGPGSVYFDGQKLFIADSNNHRVLIFNRIPLENNAAADVVIGQPDFGSNAANQGGSPGVNTLSGPFSCKTDGRRLFISDPNNSRILIYSSIPTRNNVSADFVIGQPDFRSGAASPAPPGPARLNILNDIDVDAQRIAVADRFNNRVLIFNIAESAASDLGPQFSQGKAVVGKVFWDWNGNGRQDGGIS